MTTDKVLALLRNKLDPVSEGNFTALHWVLGSIEVARHTVINLPPLSPSKTTVVVKEMQRTKDKRVNLGEYILVTNLEVGFVMVLLVSEEPEWWKQKLVEKIHRRYPHFQSVFVHYKPEPKKYTPPKFGSRTNNPWTELPIKHLRNLLELRVG